MWLIGDDFLHEIFHELQAMRIPHREGEQLTPYLYRFYNVDCVSMSMQTVTRNVMARMINALTKGINESKFLPRMIVMIPDCDILKTINFFSFSISLILGKCLNWLINSVECIIKAKKDEM